MKIRIEISTHNFLRNFAFLSGSGISNVIYKLLQKEVIYYSCPKCNVDIKPLQKTCNNCKVELDWPEESKERFKKNN